MAPSKTEKKSGAAKVSGGSAKKSGGAKTAAPAKTEGRHFTPRKALAKKDESKLAAVTEAFANDTPEVISWTERYGRKVLKHQAGLRATPAPIPPEIGPEKAAKVRELLGVVDAPPASEASENGGSEATASA